GIILSKLPEVSQSRLSEHTDLGLDEPIDTRVDPPHLRSVSTSIVGRKIRGDSRDEDATLRSSNESPYPVETNRGWRKAASSPGGPAHWGASSSAPSATDSGRGPCAGDEAHDMDDYRSKPNRKNENGGGSALHEPR
ncbi:hypothetical protein GW17_00009109, partial [Ensete ventricosum]